MTSKMNASNLTQIRERLLISLLNRDIVMEEDIEKYFPCSIESFLSLDKQLREREPSLLRCEEAGGLNNHKDIVLCVEGAKKGIELKVSETKVGIVKLTWEPWEGAVQFLQGQIKSKIMSSFLDTCGEPLFAAWFEKVKELMVVHTPSLSIPTLEDYRRVVFTIKGEKGDSAAAKLIQTLRSTESIRQAFQAKWLEFEDEWFQSHKPNDEEFLKVLTKIFEEKDYWIIINKSGAYLIEGFTVKGLTFVSVVKKPKGGSMFRYTLTLQKKSGGETKDIPINLKLYWKNGGQGVQNINLLCVSE